MKIRNMQLGAWSIVLSVAASGCIQTSMVGSVPLWNPPEIPPPQQATLTSVEEGDDVAKNLVEGVSREDGIPIDVMIDSTRLIPKGSGSRVCAILAGDSWSFFDAIYRATSRKLQRIDPNCRVEPFFKTIPGGDDVTLTFPLVIPGSRAEQWGQSPNAALIVKALKEHRTTELVILYMGGNDFIKYYGQVSSASPVDELIRRIVSDIENAVRLIEEGVTPSRKAHLKFVIVGYAKPNMEADEALKFRVNKRRWERMGRPTNQRLNSDMERLMTQIGAYSDSKENVEFINNLWEFDKDRRRGTPAEHMLNVTWNWGLFESDIFIDSIHLGKLAQHRIAEITALRIWEKGWIPRP